MPTEITPTPTAESADGVRIERALETMYSKLEKRIDAASIARLSIGDWVKIIIKLIIAELIVAVVISLIAAVPALLLFGSSILRR